MDLIVTSGGLGPTADDLTAEVVARFAGRELVLDEGMETKIAEILAGFARRLGFDLEALREANRKQAMVPEGATTIDPAGTAPGLVVPVDDGPTVIVMPGPPRELQRDVADPALATKAARAVLDRAEPYAGTMLRLFGVPESEIAKSLLEIEAEGVDARPARDHHLPAQGRARDRGPPPPGGRGRARGADRGHRRSATGGSSSAATARRSTTSSPSCSRATRSRRRSRAPAACSRRG